MALVNVPPQKVPQGLADRDPELYDYLNDVQFHQYQMWIRSGGGSDFILDIENNAYNDVVSSSAANDRMDALEQIEDLIPSIQVKEFYSDVKSADYTAIDGDFIEARNSCIITLDPEATTDDQIIVANGDGTKIKVVGAIKYTSLDDSLITSNMGSSFHFQYFGDYWRIK
jgi:hypothetical protein